MPAMPPLPAAYITPPLDWQPAPACLQKQQTRQQPAADRPVQSQRQCLKDHAAGQSERQPAGRRQSDENGVGSGSALPYNCKRANSATIRRGLKIQIMTSISARSSCKTICAFTPSSVPTALPAPGISQDKGSTAALYRDYTAGKTELGKFMLSFSEEMPFAPLLVPQGDDLLLQVPKRRYSGAVRQLLCQYRRLVFWIKTRRRLQ